MRAAVAHVRSRGNLLPVRILAVAAAVALSRIASLARCVIFTASWLSSSTACTACTAGTAGICGYPSPGGAGAPSKCSPTLRSAPCGQLGAFRHTRVSLMRLAAAGAARRVGLMIAVQHRAPRAPCPWASAGGLRRPPVDSTGRHGLMLSGLQRTLATSGSSSAAQRTNSRSRGGCGGCRCRSASMASRLARRGVRHTRSAPKAAPA